uniref:G-protein coupled receptors family 1 profile domain-containing protein n=1 Tax=Equus asinus TaxID=9793 RepID=A0A8C4MY56_EQUAS
VEPRSLRGVSEFLHLGFSKEPELQPLIFGLFLSMYLITLFGNLLIILATISDSHLHTPMYFFLLPFVEICFISISAPKMLMNIQIESKVVTCAGCITQMCFHLFFAGLDIYILSVRTCDQFLAICHTLYCTVLMNQQLCELLVRISSIMSVLHSSLQCKIVLQLLEIPHFFCELKQMVQLAFCDNFLNDIVMYFGAGLLGGGSFAGVIYSHSKIVFSLRRISSAQGKYKAFSTCASHRSVVSLFYCTSLGVYLSFAATHGSHSKARASVMYAMVTPMLNPFIYSLRNKDINKALKRLFGIKL